MTASGKNVPHAKEGAALLVALWTLVILSLIVGSFAFEIQLESMIVSHKRKKFLAEKATLSGIEYGRAIIGRMNAARELEIEGMDEDEGDFMQAALHIKRGLSVNRTVNVGDGSFQVTIGAADGGRNINVLTREEWLDILEMANVPPTEWDSMVDCLTDWIDENDLHNLNGAESDDPFYQERGYPVKNGPLDSVEELLLIKGWGEDVLYGTDQSEEGDAIFGIAELLTVWGDGKVNLNTASTDVLLSYAEYEDWELAGVVDARLGEDGEEGTLDDGIRNLNDIGADPNKFKLQSEFVRVTSVGDAFGSQYRIEAVLFIGRGDALAVYWNEGPVNSK